MGQNKVEKKKTAIKISKRAIMMGGIAAIALGAVAVHIAINKTVTETQCKDEKSFGSYYNPANPNAITIDKPIIYLYGYNNERVKVSMDQASGISISYPEYGSSGWQIIAKPDGHLTDQKTGKDLYALYYEMQDSKIPQAFAHGDGFLVEKSSISDFLDEKLTLLGLDYKEREEFITYWLPKLAQNQYNHIYFASADEINECVTNLQISPAADQQIRIWMIAEPATKNTVTKEQQLSQVIRQTTGKLIVEWSGTIR